MKRFSTYFLAAISAIFFLSACKKDKDQTPPPTPKTNSELITQASWKFNKAMMGSFDVSGGLQTCQKDNILTFQANGSGSIDEGTSKCDVADPQTTPFTWNFTNSEAVLHVSAVFFTGGNNDFNVVELTETKLVGSQVINGQTVTVTFVH
jgi:hypothetical protein